MKDSLSGVKILMQNQQTFFKVMPFLKQAIRLIFLVLAMMIVVACTVSRPVGNGTRLPYETIEGGRHYFPDDIGMEWTYTGSIIEHLQRVSTYTNITKVTGTTQKGDERVTIFHESNPANRGESESYFKRNKEGITYFGGEPTTDFERQFIPYRVIPFPIVFQKPYVQIEKTGLLYDIDMDNDGINEKADIRAEVIAMGFETITTPAGIFRNALKLQGRMIIGLTLSVNHKKAEMLDTTTHWFAPGVGMVQGIEKIEFSSVAGSTPSGTLITEILQRFNTNGTPSPFDSPGY